MCAAGRGEGALGVWDWDLLITAWYQAPYTLPEWVGWIGTFTVVYTIVHFRPRDWGWSVHCVYRCSPGFVFCARGHIEGDYESNRGEVATFGRILARFVVRFRRIRKNVYASADR